MTTDFEIKDEDRILKFTGVLLGESSSESADKKRWAEISIFRTKGNQYVVAGCGRTVLPNESDKFWATVCESPEGVIERLHMLDKKGSRYMPHVSKDALRQARYADPVVAQAYLVENVE